MSSRDPRPGAAAPELDYRRTAARAAWQDLPRGVRRAVGEAAGSPVVGVESRPAGGFTVGFAATVRLADGRRVFAKAAWSDRAHVLSAYEREARVLAALPDAVPAPRLVGSVAVPADDAGPGLTGPDRGAWDWHVLVMEVLDGHLPHPWTERDLGLVHEACVATYEALTPVPGALAELGLPSLAQKVGADGTASAGLVAGGAPVLAVYDDLARGAGAPPDQPAWLPARAAELAAVVARAPDLLGGQTGCHCDLRADNLLVGSDRAWLVDWNWLCVGAGWTDFVGLLPLARAEGVDVDAWLRRSALTRDADPDAVDAWLAAVAAYSLFHAGNPHPQGDAAAIRVHQRRYARTFLDWLGARRGWA